MSTPKQPKQDNVVFKKKKGFTQVQNWATDDMALSDKALGLYTRIQRWITFEAEDFVCSKAFIRTKTPSGEKAFESAWNELKEKGYLKMYCVPPATWTAELLDEPKPEDPHTFYLNTEGEIKSTNVDRAKKKAAKLAEKEGSEYYPQNGSNTPETEYYPQNRGNTKRGNTNRSNTNGGNNIITSSNSFNNTFNNNPSIYPGEAEAPQPKRAHKKETTIDRLIDADLIEEIKEQIDYEILSTAKEYRITAGDLDAVVEAIAVLKTATEPMKFGDSTYSPEFIRQRANMIDAGHVEYVFECFYDHREDVRNIKKYLTTAVFNAPATQDSYYSNRVIAAGLI